MLDAKDLRIGNYLNKNLKSGNGRILTDKIGCQDIVRIYQNTGSINYEPIELTEEWLLRFGFEVDDDLGDQIYYQIPNQKNGYGICFDHDDIAFYKFYGNGGENVHTLIHDEEHLQYVHQLQNLYFALTGKELEFKL